MSKRPHAEDYSRPQHKKPKHDDRNRRPTDTSNGHRPSPQRSNGHDRRDEKRGFQTVPSYEDAIAQLPAPTSTLPPVAAYHPFTVPPCLPPLPDIDNEHLRTAPFRHKSTTTANNRSIHLTPDTTYEQLEFLGDAQLEHIASRLLYTHFPRLTAGQQSQLRELLVKNETLAEYARAYGFDKRVQVGDLERMLEATRGSAGNKGFNKVLGDVFEAYVAAVVLSHGDEGFAVAEKWMTTLWAPKLVEAAAQQRYFTPGLVLQHADTGTDQSKTYNPAAKAELQKLVLGGQGVKLVYEAYQSSVELKGDRLGQNQHFIAVYLSGYGLERKVLGRGEGKNKVEAGNWAAQEAMFGEGKGTVEECAKKLAAIKEEKRREREAKEAAEVGEVGKG
ncbi:hypothetical protein LTR53_010458 [Teratosphaeriaceae sp. CCFEE 6253]|nr:hypothetical protein LTR53_010458 [Teratosphaeriaceae sp. CCFEE 6253]